jgi:hypothetical protein
LVFHFETTKQLPNEAFGGLAPTLRPVFDKPVFLLRNTNRLPTEAARPGFGYRQIR